MHPISATGVARRLSAAPENGVTRIAFGVSGMVHTTLGVLWARGDKLDGR